MHWFDDYLDLSLLGNMCFYSKTVQQYTRCTYPDGEDHTLILIIRVLGSQSKKPVLLSLQIVHCSKSHAWHRVYFWTPKEKNRYLRQWCLFESTSTDENGDETNYENKRINWFLGKNEDRMTTFCQKETHQSDKSHFLSLQQLRAIQLYISRSNSGQVQYLDTLQTTPFFLTTVYML